MAIEEMKNMQAKLNELNRKLLDLEADRNAAQVSKFLFPDHYN